MAAAHRAEPRVFTLRFDRQAKLRIAAAAGGALLVGVVLAATMGRADASTPSSAPVLLSGPTTTTTPAIDPTSNLGLLSPTAAALIGPEYDERRELARRASEVMTASGIGQCGLFLGAPVAGEWEVSSLFGVAHPVPLMAGCPFPTTATTAKAVAAS